MHVHLVFVTKYRRDVFSRAILDDLRTIFASVCADFEAEWMGFDGEDNHLHLLVNRLKGVSSRLIWRKKYSKIRKKLWGRVLWSHSSFAESCGGAPIEIIRQYIEQQQTPH